MPSLSFVDRKQLESLFGMEGGVVLDFSNRTFRDFVFETSGVDIYTDRFNKDSGSKANRLRAFWELQPARDVGKLILALCQYQRRCLFEGVDSKLWNSCVEIGNRLSGRVPPAPKEPSTVPAKPYSPRTASASIVGRDSDQANPVDLDRLLVLFEEMAVSSDPQRRGYQLQDLLNALFKVFNISMVRPFTRNNGGEQIDGAFKFEGWHYVVESRWREKLADIRELDGLHGQVQRSGKQTMGIFLSINGWSVNVPALLKQNQDKSIFLIDGYDVRCVLAQEIGLADLLNRKLAHLNINAEPFLSAAQAHTLK